MTKSVLPKFVSYEHLRALELSTILPEEIEDTGWGYVADMPYPPGTQLCAGEDCREPHGAPLMAFGEGEELTLLCEACVQAEFDDDVAFVYYGDDPDDS